MKAAYPSHREADVALRDGSTLHVRPARPEDRDALLEFLRALSPDSLRLRFFSPGSNLSAAADWASSVDYRDRYGLIATAGPRHRIVGHAGYERSDGDRAEVAFAIADEYQGRGVGTILLAHLAEAAQEQDVEVFEATVLPDNYRMAEVFRESGFAPRIRSKPDLITVEFPTTVSEEALERFEERDRTAAVAAIGHFLDPRSVAVVGASRERGTVGGEVFHNLLSAGFNGPVFPINPRADVVQSVPSFKSIRDVAGEVELAVVTVPAAVVVDAARECAAKGVRALVVISAGFGETGEEGSRRQQELLGVCRDSGMRLIGPNCLGIINTSDEVRLNASFGPHYPPARERRVSVAERRARSRDRRLRAEAQPGAVVLRIGRQQGGHLGQRPDPVLGVRRTDRPDPALSRIVRKPAQVRPDRPPYRKDQADPRRQERPLRCGCTGHLFPHRCAGGSIRHNGRHALPAGGGGAHRHPR